MNFTVIICVLFIAYSSSFSISKSKQAYHKHIHRQEEQPNENEVYEVVDRPDSMKFIYPKAKTPTLREIIYYHVIERPSGGGSIRFEESSSYNGSEDDEVETERPFTNGHGYQFLPEPGHNNNTSDEEEAVTTEIIEIQSEEETSGKEQEDEETTEFEPTTTELSQNIEDDLLTHPKIISTKTSKENTSPKEERGDKEVENASIGSSTTEEEETEITTAPSIDPRNGVDKDEVGEKERSARAALFRLAREKYHNNRTTKKQHRRRRRIEASDIPEAPTLRPLNLDSLPEYARKLISTSAPKTTKEKAVFKKPTNTEEELQKELQERIEEIMATLKPKALEDDNTDRDESIHEEHGTKRIARTYGMNLTEDQGYVWNDLLGDPGMFIEVGEPKEKNEIPQHHEPTETPSVIISSTHYSVESKPIYTENSNEKDRDQDNESADSDDIYVEVKTNRTTDIIEHSTKKDIENNIEEHTKKPSDTTTRKDGHTDSATERNESTTESSENDANKVELEKSSKESGNSNKDVTAVKEHSEETVSETKFDDEKSGTNTDKVNDKKNGTMDEKARKAIVEITKSELLQELLKNEQFWKWLGDWTNTYTELLMKHIKHMVHEEVGRQMKNYTATLKKEIQKDIEEALRLKEQEPIKEDREKSNAKSDDSTNAVINLELIKALENEKGNHGDVKIIIDGKELPLTHSSNLKGDVLLKRRKIQKHTENEVSKHNGELENKDSKPIIEVTAQNVYGNSAGSDKVTNIFLFYPNDDAIIKDFKPTDDGDSFSIDKRKEDDVADLVAQKDESTSTTDVPSKEETTKTSADKDVDATKQADAKENKSDVTTQKVSTENNKENDSNKQQEHIKGKDDTTEANITTEATTKPNESTSEANKQYALENKESTENHKDEIANNKIVTDKRSEDLEKVAVTTEHSDTEKDVTTTAKANEDTTTASLEKDKETIERATVEDKDVVKTSTSESVTKDSKATSKDDKESHTETTSTATEEPKS